MLPWGGPRMLSLAVAMCSARVIPWIPSPSIAPKIPSIAALPWFSSMSSLNLSCSPSKVCPRYPVLQKESGIMLVGVLPNHHRSLQIR